MLFQVSSAFGNQIGMKKMKLSICCLRKLRQKTFSLHIIRFYRRRNKQPIVLPDFSIKYSWLIFVLFVVVWSEFHFLQSDLSPNIRNLSFTRIYLIFNALYELLSALSFRLRFSFVYPIVYLHKIIYTLCISFELLIFLHTEEKNNK